MKMNLEGKKAIITGSNQGLGRAIAKSYISAGADVMLFARDKQKIYETYIDLKKYLRNKQKLSFLDGDVTNEKDVENLISKSIDEIHGCNILVNNAGIYGPKGNLEDIQWEELKKAININLLGSVLTIKKLIPLFKKNNFGKIIQISGGGATKPLPFLNPYATSKAGIVRFCETLSEELKEYKIDINSIAPGALNTRLLDEILDAGPHKVGIDFYKQALKQKETGGTSFSYATELCVFLGSDLSNGITGKLISAIWDEWSKFPDFKEKMNRSDIYTLRRIVGKERSLGILDK